MPSSPICGYSLSECMLALDLVVHSLGCVPVGCRALECSRWSSSNPSRASRGVSRSVSLALRLARASTPILPSRHESSLLCLLFTSRAFCRLCDKKNFLPELTPCFEPRFHCFNQPLFRRRWIEDFRSALCHVGFKAMEPWHVDAADKTVPECSPVPSHQACSLAAGSPSSAS